MQSGATQGWQARKRGGEQRSRSGTSLLAAAIDFRASSFDFSKFQFHTASDHEQEPESARVRASNDMGRSGGSDGRIAIGFRAGARGGQTEDGKDRGHRLGKW